MQKHNISQGLSPDGTGLEASGIQKGVTHELEASRHSNHHSLRRTLHSGSTRLGPILPLPGVIYYSG